GASPPSATGGPGEGHRCWPRQENGCPPAAGVPAPPPVGGPRPGPPRAGEPGACFSEVAGGGGEAQALWPGGPGGTAGRGGARGGGEPGGVGGGELFRRGAIVPRKRPRGRPRKTDVAA